MVIVRSNIYWATPGFGVDACGGGGLFVAPLGGGPSTQISSDCVVSLTLSPDTMYWIATPLLGHLQPEQLWSASLPDAIVTHQSTLPRFMDAIHWTSNALIGAGTDGLIQIEPDGTFSRTLVPNPLGVSTDSVVADAERAYYIRTENGVPQQVVSVPLRGGEPQVIASAPCSYCLSGLVVDSGSLFWIQKETNPSTYASTGAVMTAPSAGGPVKELARGHPHPSESAPGGLAVADGFVYWTDLDWLYGGTIEKTPIAGGPTTLLIAPRNWLGTEVAVDDRYLYFLGIADRADPRVDPPPDRIVYRACR